MWARGISEGGSSELSRILEKFLFSTLRKFSVYCGQPKALHLFINVVYNVRVTHTKIHCQASKKKMDYEKDIDWGKIAKRLPLAKDTRISSAHLPQIDYYFEKAWCEASNRSMAADVQSLLITQLRTKAKYEAIAFLANQHGLSFEEAFIRLATEKPLSD